MHEMDVKGVKFDRFTYIVLLNACGANSDLEGFEKILTKLESDPNLDINWGLYANAAFHYQRFGFPDKALNLLEKSEKLVSLVKKRHEALAHLLTIYARAGKKEDVSRVWEKCKNYKVSNLCYKKVLSSILKFDDLETAEHILDEWEGSFLSRDIRVPNLLIRMYCKKVLMDKVESLVERLVSTGSVKPDLFTWYWMSFGYVESNQTQKATEAMKRAIMLLYTTGNWEPDKVTLAACLQHLKEVGDPGQLSQFVRLPKDHNIISSELRARLLEYFSGEDVLEGYESNHDTQHLEGETD